MARRSTKSKRKQREQKWIEDQLEEHTGPSEGQYWVLNMETWEKTPGLNYKQAQALWESLPRAAFFSMDDYSQRPAPGRAVFDAGKLP